MSIRVSKSTAFSPISPSRARYSGYEYRAFPVSSCRLVITEVPEDVSVIFGDGSNAVFSIIASGDGRLTYQWQVDDGNGFADIANGGDYSGATTRELTITTPDVSTDGYLYRCVVTNPCGSEASAYATLTVNVYCPEVTVQPTPQSILETENTQFSVTATIVVGTISYQWQVSTNSGGSWANLANDATYSDVTTDTLTITAAGVALTGYLYRCVLTNLTCDVNSDSAELTVTPPSLASPAFTSESGSATLIGFVEMTSPSTPPKKYRTLTLSGTQSWCVDGTCTITDKNNAGAREWTGGLAFNAITGAKTFTGMLLAFNSASDGNCGVVAFPAWDITFVNGDYFPGGDEDVPTIVPLIWNAQFPPTYTSGQTWKMGDVEGQCLGVPAAYKNHGYSRLDLTDEDTEDDAIVRSTPASGSSAQSYRETRGAGDFTFLWQDSTFGATANDLVVGSDYQVALDILTEDYGGGSGVTSQILYPFTASGASEGVSIPIPCASGKQVTASNPTISAI